MKKSLALLTTLALAALLLLPLAADTAGAAPRGGQGPAQAQAGDLLNPARSPAPCG